VTRGCRSSSCFGEPRKHHGRRLASPSLLYAHQDPARSLLRSLLLLMVRLQRVSVGSGLSFVSRASGSWRRSGPLPAQAKCVRARSWWFAPGSRVGPSGRSSHRPPTARPACVPSSTCETGCLPLNVTCPWNGGTEDATPPPPFIPGHTPPPNNTTPSPYMDPPTPYPTPQPAPSPLLSSYCSSAC